MNPLTILQIAAMATPFVQKGLGRLNRDDSSYSPITGQTYTNDSYRARQELGYLQGGNQPIGARTAVGDAAWQTQAKAVQELINRNLTQNTIPMINREWSNRYGSGQRQEAISRASEEANFAGSNAIAQLALQQWLGQTGMEEERAWRQAQLDAQPGWTDQLASGLGSILPYLALAYMNKGSNPALMNTGVDYNYPMNTYEDALRKYGTPYEAPVWG